MAAKVSPRGHQRRTQYSKTRRVAFAGYQEALDHAGGAAIVTEGIESIPSRKKI